MRSLAVFAGVAVLVTTPVAVEATVAVMAAVTAAVTAAVGTMGFVAAKQGEVAYDGEVEQKTRAEIDVDEDLAAQRSGGAEIVSLDAFRKK